MSIEDKEERRSEAEETEPQRDLFGKVVCRTMGIQSEQRGPQQTLARSKAQLSCPSPSLWFACCFLLPLYKKMIF